LPALSSPNDDTESMLPRSGANIGSGEWSVRLVKFAPFAVAGSEPSQISDQRCAVP